MRGHANLQNNNPDPEQPVNGGNNNQEERSYEITLSPPDGWESWMPTTGVGDSSDTETIIFTAATEATPDNASVTFHLSGVTSYEGRYMNDKNGADHNGADLYFAPAAEQKTKYGDKVTWSGGGENSTSVTASWGTRPVKTPVWLEIPVKIVCNDHAAYGKIQATVSAGGKSRIHKIPKDDQPVYRMLGIITMTGNKIADAWEAGKTDPLTGNPAILLPWRDRDWGGDMQNPYETTGLYYHHGRNNGDGFSALEEYRGFVIGGGYTRLDPFTKDVFIGSALRPNPDYGNLTITVGHVGYGGSIPGMNVHRVTNESEWKVVGGYYQMNYTRGGVVGNPQRGILVREGSAGGNPGWRLPAGDPALNHGAVCEINLALINKSKHHPQIKLDATIAHEIGHAVGLGHHNERTMMRDPTKPRSAHVGPPPDKKWLLMYPDDPSKDSCVMGGGNMDASVWRIGGYRNFHSPVPAGLVPSFGPNPKWEDHWGSYWLHDNHSNHKEYGEFGK